MILYVFQSFLWYYKYRYGTFYSQNYRVIPSVSIRYIDVIHLHQSWQKKKKNKILRICYSTVTWIYTEMKNQGNTTRANFQSSNSSTFYHHPHTSQFLPFSLADLVQTLLWGSHAPAAQPPGITRKHRRQYLPWVHRAAATRLRAPQSLPPETGGLSRARTPVSTENVLTQLM